MKILLVEDNLLNHDITAVINGRDALSALNSNRFDLILMDIMLPEMSGIDVTVEIRKIEQEANADPVPIVALTANTLDNDREKCFKAGMNDYLSKPFTVDQLVAVIDKYN